MTKEGEKQLKKPYLSWTLKDYQDANEEAPGSLIASPSKSEGELMSDAEIANWILDCRKTFQVVRGENDKVYNQLYQDFLLDVEYLVQIGRLDEDTADEIMDVEE